jgi:hypothetical protein
MRLSATRLTAAASAAQRLFNPRSLFASGEQGAWYDPSDMSTLFQDAAGTTPVTAVEQPVGLMLDKSKGLVLGPELVVNGEFDSGVTGWVGAGVTVSAYAGTLRVVSLGVGSGFYGAGFSVVSGTTYQITFTIKGDVAYAGLQFGLRRTSSLGSFISTTFTPSVTASYTQFTAHIVASSTVADAAFFCRFAGTEAVNLDNISVRELPGNHATQSTAASRPVLSARYNLLEKTQQFDDAYWTKTGTITPNTGIAPDETTTADKLAAGTLNFITRSTSGLTAGLAYKAGVWIKSAVAGKSASLRISLSVGQAVPQQSLAINTTDDWVFYSINNTPTSSLMYFQIGEWSANGWGPSKDILVWGADLRVANDGVNLPPYQRVNTATYYDTVGFPLYLRADGVDDGMVTNSIDFTGTDKMTVVAGVRKLSDAARGVFAELGNGSVNTNQWVLNAPTAALGDFGWSSAGTAAANAVSAVAAPATRVATGIGDISGDSSILRLNGAQAASSAADQGTGNYGNHPLYLFRRGGTTLPFNGRCYGLIVRGAQSTDAQIAQAERWMNGRTRAY